MSIVVSQEAGLVAECDTCGADSEGIAQGFPRGEFRSFIETIQKCGWAIRHEAGAAWEHLCPDCQQAAEVGE